MDNDKPEINLAKIFNSFAKKAVSDFPELEGKLAIYDIPTDTLYGAFSENKREDLLRIAQKYAQTVGYGAGKIGWAAYVLRPSQVESEANYLISIVSPSITLPTLKHELGHLVGPGGRGQHENFNECVANAFSALYQQKNNTDIQNEIELTNTQNAGGIVLRGKTSHFSLPVLRELDRLSRIYDLPAIASSPIEAANLAYRLSVHYALPQKELDETAKFFEPVQQVLKDPGVNLISAIEECAKITFDAREETSQTAYLSAKTWITQFLEPRHAAWREKYLTPGFWDDLQRRIDEKEAALQKDADTPEQRLAREAKDMMVLGRFDKNPGSEIDPAVYESQQNMAYLQRAMFIYVSQRHAQETTGSPRAIGGKTIDVMALDQNQIIALACQIAGADMQAPPPAPRQPRSQENRP